MIALKICILTACVAASLCAADENSAKPASWSRQAAAAYLDSRLIWWSVWPVSARDHDTFCVSCHTVLPYALSRPALRATLGEKAPSIPERKLLANVTKRVRMWKEVEPFYPDAKRGVPKTAESRGTESVLNAVILTAYNTPDARLALGNMMALQLTSGDAKGAWSWLQFHFKPWEGDSQYYGAVLAAIAIGAAPADYRATPDVQEHIKLLRDYLVRNRDSQVLIDRVLLLWAGTKIPGLVTPAQQKSIIEEALSKQQEDGGFSLSSFVAGWKRVDSTPLETKSDGYATGLVTVALQQAGIPRDQPQLKRALAWLRQNQDKTEGRWLAYSLNKNRDVSSDFGRFMSDAATAYAVLALERAEAGRN